MLIQQLELPDLRDDEGRLRPSFSLWKIPMTTTISKLRLVLLSTNIT